MSFFYFKEKTNKQTNVLFETMQFAQASWVGPGLVFGARETLRARKRKSETGLQEAVCSAQLLGLFPELISHWCPAMQSRDRQEGREIA